MKLKIHWITLSLILAAFNSTAELIKFHAGDPIIAEEININFQMLEEKIDLLTNVISAGVPGEPFNYKLDVDLENGFDYYITDVLYRGGDLERNYRCPKTYYISITAAKEGNILNEVTPVKDMDTSCFVSSKKLDFSTPIKVQGGQKLQAYGDLSLRILGYKVLK